MRGMKNAFSASRVYQKGLLSGGGILRTIISNLAKSRNIKPSEYLKIKTTILLKLRLFNILLTFS